MLSKVNYKGWSILVRKNNIIEEAVDAIVNPANEYLTNGAGAAKEIEEAAGHRYRAKIDKYLKQYDFLPAGEAMTTIGGNLPCKYVINAVGPKCEENQTNFKKEAKLLKNLLVNIFNEVIEYDIRSVSILAISTGLFKFPLDLLTEIYSNRLMKIIDKYEEEMKGRTIALCKTLFWHLGNFDDEATKAMLEGNIYIV